MECLAADVDKATEVETTQEWHNDCREEGQNEMEY